ncbi:sensor histidine kinase [Paenibacillus sp. ACRRY]|uniref:cache domain-containing sensor histidine kinase n=1 Tax=Paenibacillus TaxID=44249 RepID=UPI001EF4F889|nr:sensor histidine kinase [Paenibacillus sp. ACRRY]MCG7381688.1 histidine kinase [Paenibacillus sp. ACRRY]
MRIKSVNAKIFIRYSALITILIAVFLIAFSLYMESVLRKQSVQSMNQISANILDTVNLELKNLYSTALKIVASEPVRAPFFQDTSDPTILYNVRNKLASAVLSINGPIPNFYKLYMYRNDGFIFQYGKEFDAVNGDAKTLLQQDWAIQTLMQNGKRSISPPREDKDEPDQSIISVNMAFAEVFGGKASNIITVEQKYEVFARIIEKAVMSNDLEKTQHKKVYVIDQNGQLVYPYSKDKEINSAMLDKINFFHEAITQNLSANILESSEIQHQLNYDRTLAVYSRSSFSGWTVLLEEPESSLMEPIVTFNMNIILLGISALAVALAMSFFVSRSLTRPLKHISKSIKMLDFDTLGLPKKSIPISSIDELEELNRTFIEMRSRLKESLEEAVSARSHEVESRLLALQAQMNPHFLYNSLSVISILCEEGKNIEAQMFCKGLSRMLRYVSSNNFSSVGLVEELQYTRDYVQLMGERYGEMLRCEVNVPPEMESIKIPKLVIQPLVENAIKHGASGQPPWVIRITGKILSGGWMVTISDNGTGFDPGKLELLKEKFRSFDSGTRIPEISVDGMGMLNIYIRLRMFYETNMIFDISESGEGGAAVTIGGFTQQKEGK